MTTQRSAFSAWPKLVSSVSVWCVCVCGEGGGGGGGWGGWGEDACRRPEGGTSLIYLLVGSLQSG